MIENATQCGMEYTKNALIRDKKHQVMMEWEKPWMEACVDALEPSGDVLEIGYGMGYSAERFHKYDIDSHTIVECHPTVIAQAEMWSEKYMDKVCIIRDVWQNVVDSLGKYDCIFFDDYPLITENDDYTLIQKVADSGRGEIFLHKAFDYLMKDGGRACIFLNKPESGRKLLRDRFDIKYSESSLYVTPSKDCKYYKSNKALIPIYQKLFV